MSAEITEDADPKVIYLEFIVFFVVMALPFFATADIYEKYRQKEMLTRYCEHY